NPRLDRPAGHAGGRPAGPLPDRGRCTAAPPRPGGVQGLAAHDPGRYSYRRRGPPVTPSTEIPTYAALLTPAGTAALATLALEGPRAWQVVSELFRPLAGKQAWPPAKREPGQFWLGRLGEQPQGPAADEVVLAVQRMTPVPRVEVHCHGGVEVVRWLLETFAARGVQVCSWQDLERRTTGDPVRTAAAA